MNSYTIEFKNAAGDLPADLWDACFPSPLEGRWWYEALEQCGLGDQFRFFYALIREGGKPVGIAPLFLMDVPLDLVVPEVWLPLVKVLGRLHRAFRYQRTLFVGSPCSDEGTVGLLPGIERLAALAALQGVLSDKARQLDAQMIVWKDFPDDYDKELHIVAAQNGMFRLDSFPGTVVDLPGASRTAYMASLKSSRRNNFKRKLKRSEAALAVDIEVFSQPEGPVLDEIFGLFWQTYEKATTRFERLNREFFDHIARVPHAHFIVLRERATGRMVAFMLCFLFEGKAINKFVGIDYTLSAEAYLYFRLWDAAVAWACAQGAKELQSGQTGYSAKLRLGHRLKPLSNWCRHRNPLIHAIYRKVAASISWATLDADLAQYLAAYPEALPKRT